MLTVSDNSDHFLTKILVISQKKEKPFEKESLEIYLAACSLF